LSKALQTWVNIWTSRLWCRCACKLEQAWACLAETNSRSPAWASGSYCHEWYANDSSTAIRCRRVSWYGRPAQKPLFL